ncbi:hypothetical protein GDO86_010330, partial [Hymenochirus boettgeri]
MNQHNNVTRPNLPLPNGTLPQRCERNKRTSGQECMELWLNLKSDPGKALASEDWETGTSFCKPYSDIFFLKTHKTGSSTIMNILFRYGEFHNLTFALPSYNSMQFFYPNYFTASSVEGFYSHRPNTFNIMCHHMRFLLTEVQRVMPKDTFYFTILRNPISLMESSFSYYKTLPSFSKARSLEEFLRNPFLYYQGNSHARNFMTYDLGFDHNGKASPKRFQLTARLVESTFNLVLITEYFDESLVLLKDALCWTFDEVLSFPLNSRSETTKKSISPPTQERIKHWNQLDWQLYDHFNNSFWNRVESFGRERMQREVNELRERRAHFSKVCLKDTVDGEKIKNRALMPYQPGKAKIIGYNVKSGLGKAKQLLCQRMVTPEIQYTEILRTNQRRRKFQATYKKTGKK